MVFIYLMEQFNICRKGHNNFSHALGFIVGSRPRINKMS